MRELKFRAWHKNKKIMKEVLSLIGDGNFFVKCNVNAEQWWNGCDKESDFVLMQCTGLKDKNKKMIYEGDIVIVDGGFMESDYKTTVVYLDGAFYPLVYVKESYNCIDDYYPEKFEVIGNIYENSELLESEE